MINLHFNRIVKRKTMTNEILCRLCLEEKKAFIEVHGELGRELKINEIILRHFDGFDIKSDDQISNKVCTECWHKTEDFHNLYNRIQRAQERITVIYDSQINLLDEKQQSLRDIIIQNVDEHIDDQVTFEFKVESHTGDLENQLGSSFEISTEHCSIGEKVAEEVFRDDDNDDGIDNNHDGNDDDDDDNDYDDIDKNMKIEKDEKIESQESESLHRKTKKKRKSKLVGLIQSPLQEKENNDNVSVYMEDFHSDDEEYISKMKGKRIKRKPFRKEKIEAEKEKEEKLIESYYKMICEICHEGFNKFEVLFEHYQSIHCIRGFILCCGKKFHRRPTIAEHALWHTNPDLFKCKICNKSYAVKRCLNNHLLAHAPPDMKLYKCAHCPKSFVKKFKLDQHKLSHLTPEEKKYMCNECDKPYASDALLRAHKRVVHEKTYAHMCEICAKVFKSRVFFEKHQLEHLGQNLPRVQCQICNAWMKNEHTMRAHMRLHQDAGMIHRCDICGRQGPSRNAILKHKRFVHLSERKFKCTLCDKAFKRAITLKEHMTVHTGEVLYTCTFCPKTFNSGANMHAHKKKVHPAEWEEEKRTKQLSIKSENIS